MLDRALSNTPLAKAIRVVLVFTLVFWVSFRVECLAFAQMYVDSGSDHENDVLAGLSVHDAKYDDAAGDWNVGPAVRSAADEQGSPQARDLVISASQGQLQLVAIPEWEAGQQPEGPEGPGGDEPDPSPSGEEPSGSSEGDDPDPSEGSGGGEPEPGGENEGGNDQSEEPTTTDDEENRPTSRPVVSPQANDDVTIASFVKWEILEGSEFADLESDDEGKAMLTGKGTKSGTVRIACSLADGFSGNMADGLSAGLPIEVNVKVEAPYVGALTLMKPEPGSGESCTDGETIELEESQRGSYQFWAQVQITDAASGDTRAIDVTPDNLLSAQSAFDDLKWAVLDEAGNEPVDGSVATISNTGELKLTGNGPVIVKCSSEQGLDGNPISAQVKISAKNAPVQDDPEARQGESHPQDKLKVVIQKPKAPETSEGDEGGEGSSDASADPSSGESAPAEGAGEGEGSEPNPSGVPEALPDVPPSDEAASSGAAASVGSENPEGEGGASGESAEPTYDVSEKEYDVAALEAFEGGFGQETYQLKVDGQIQKVSGKGVTLAMLLADAGLSLEDQANIDKIVFDNGNGGACEVNWSDLVSVSQASQSHVMVAVQAYVHKPETPAGESGDAAEGGEGEPAEGEPAEPGEGDQPGSGEGEPSEGAEEIAYYDNTRFQLLYGDAEGVIDGTQLRWINSMIVTLKQPEPAPVEEPEDDDPLDVSISYVPVPKGRTAFLSAVPNLEIGGARFGFTWERSIDGGTTWTTYNDESIQTLRVMTDDEHIGNQFRVIIDTDLKNEETGELRSKTSKPVTIVVGSGLVLDYVPPLAGEIAEFVSHFELSDEDHIDTSNPQYIWEQSSDGGQTWQALPGQAGSTLRIPTNPIDESASSEDSEPVTLIYIRVRAVVPNHDPLESNWCPLTVRTGDTSGGGGKPDNGSSKANTIGKALNEDPDGENTNPNNKGSNKNKKKKKVREIPSPTVEHSSSTIADYLDDYDDDGEDDEETDITDAGVVIDDTVTKKIKAQEKAAKQEKEQSQPGARWTEITPNSPSEEVQNILADNPFAPYALPFGLGIALAGGLEKLIAFRRQL